MLTPFEIIGNIDLRGLADDELAAIIKNLAEEQTKRKHDAYILAWGELVKHIKKFCEEFGEIRVRDEFFDETNDFNEVGEIW